MSGNNLPEKFPNFVIFKTADGKVNIDVYFQDEYYGSSPNPVGKGLNNHHLK